MTVNEKSRSPIWADLPVSSARGSERSRVQIPSSPRFPFLRSLPIPLGEGGDFLISRGVANDRDVHGKHKPRKSWAVKGKRSKSGISDGDVD